MWIALAFGKLFECISPSVSQTKPGTTAKTEKHMCLKTISSQCDHPGRGTGSSARKEQTETV